LAAEAHFPAIEPLLQALSGGLDQLFDLSAPRSDAVLLREPAEVEALPLGRRILHRAREAGLAPRELGELLLQSRSLPDAAAGLGNLGLLKEGEGADAFAGGDAASYGRFRYGLNTVWREVFSDIRLAHGVDRRWAVPALKVASPSGITFYLHSVVHGELSAGINGWAVRSLVRRLAEAGSALYSEQNFPSFFGYNYGQETLDHGVRGKNPAPLASAGLDANASLGARLSRLLLFAAGAATIILPLFWLWREPGSAAAWVVGAASLLFHYLRLLAFTPLRRLIQRGQAKEAAAENPEAAEKLEFSADLWRVGPQDPAVFLRADLPMPLKGSLESNSAPRSSAMAQAIVKDALSRGVTSAHVLTGVKHLDELAWHLSLDEDQAASPRP
jgi:hypothetical protein